MIRNNGFSLIELMVVVAIVAILAGIALPSYQDSIRKSRRVVAQNALLDLAAKQERWYLQNNQYNGNVGSLIDGTAAATYTPPDGFYQVTVSTATPAPCPAGANTCYLFTATAIDSQAADTDCATFTLNSLGNKASTPTNNCW